MAISSTKPNAVHDLMRPGRCYSREAIDSFLQYSRKSSDDGINTLDPKSRSCGEYIAGTLYQAWLSRDTLINYCENVAQSGIASNHEKLHENQSTPPDSRLDPYGARDYNKPSTPPEQSILDWVSTQRNIENIIRSSSAKLLAEKCGTYSTDAQFFLDGYEQGIKGSLPRISKSEAK